MDVSDQLLPEIAALRTESPSLLEHGVDRGNMNFDFVKRPASHPGTDSQVPSRAMRVVGCPQSPRAQSEDQQA